MLKALAKRFEEQCFYRNILSDILDIGEGKAGFF